ncbi:hypothetical protein CB1_001118030 [Camelus ferus]|nr:hypothetical protein CB1_001118030 [Camelus ferus]
MSPELQVLLNQKQDVWGPGRELELNICIRENLTLFGKSPSNMVHTGLQDEMNSKRKLSHLKGYSRAGIDPGDVCSSNSGRIDSGPVGYGFRLAPGLGGVTACWKVEEMSTIGDFEGFQPVSLKQEGDDQPSETDLLSTEEGSPGKDPSPRQISRLSSVTESALYPNPYHQHYIARKYFVTRPGAIETAMEDLKGHVDKTSGETIQGFWLLTEIDHWNNEKERILLVTDKTLLICKYDFIMLSCVQLQWIPLSAVYRICLGKFSFPGMSLDKKRSDNISTCRLWVVMLTLFIKSFCLSMRLDLQHQE